MSVDSVCHILPRTYQESCSCVSACRLMYPLLTCVFSCQPVFIPLVYLSARWSMKIAFGLCAHQSNELTRGPPELVKHFRLWGSSHRRKSAAWPSIDMVCLYHSPISVGRRGGNLLVQIISTCRHGLRGGGGAGQHPVVCPHVSCFGCSYLDNILWRWRTAAAWPVWPDTEVVPWL